MSVMLSADGRPAPSDRLLTRVARLAVRVGQLGWLVHRYEDHGGRVSVCLHPVCLKTRAVLEENRDPA